jgi:thiamine pyrophosphate-dependent acetolactate synthase large subunit-like protein
MAGSQSSSALLRLRAGRFAIIRQLMADGIDCMFGNPGTTEENILDALGESEFERFKYYLAMQEGSVVAMADGYARAARRPAVVQLHSYAGLANGLGMIYYARRGYTPMVVLCGEAGIQFEALDGQMAADLVAMARPFVKSDTNGPCAWRATHHSSLLRLLRRALKTAATPPLGPVFLALPMDVLEQEITEDIYPSLPVRSNVLPSHETIQEAAKLLAASKSPIILMGDGIAASQAQAELAEVAESLGAVVWGANCSEVNMSASHPLFGGSTGHMFGETSKPIISAADAVLICGTTVLPEVFPSTDNVFAKDAHVIHFDLNTYEIGKNFPLSLGALGDPKCTLAALSKELSERLTVEQRSSAKTRMLSHRAAKEKKRQDELAVDATRDGEVPLRAFQFMRELSERLPPDAIIFDEALTHSPELCRYLPQDIPGTYFQTRAGMLGTGLPSTLGLKIANPDKLVIGFSGDGGSMSTIQSLTTAARYNIGAKFVVLNNRSYRILKQNLQVYWQSLNQNGRPATRTFPDSFDLLTPELRFDQLAEAQGVSALRVETPERIAPALDRALADNNPFLIDLVLSNSL